MIAELPVAWWSFWLFAVSVIAFTAFIWWLARAALREDREASETERHSVSADGTADEAAPAGVSHRQP